MELELKKACFDAYEAAGELTLTQEETAETIVPDYCPDIARIIETTGKVFLHSREMRDGRAEISGTVRVTVLYTPEGEGGIRTLEFAMPFTVETDGRSLPDCAALLADTEPELLETRMLNPRKVFTHCKLVTRLTGYQRSPLCFCTDAEAGPELCIEKKQEQQHAIVLTHIAEKDFTFSEQMDLSPGREGAAEILTSRVNSTVTETKIVGSKLLFKGIFTVSLLYRTADGRCCAASGELPFSQILEVEGAPEGAEPSVRLQFTGADLQVDGADAEGREIAVTLYLHATALLRQTQELTLLSDLYSTAYDLTYDAAPLELTSFREQFTRRQTVREVLEIGVVADSILALSVTCGAVSVSREGAGVVLRTGASVRALYLDEGGVPLVAERSIDVSCQLELPEDCRVAARAVCPEEVQGSLTSDLYSTAYDLTYDAAPLELTSFREQFTRRQTVREVLEIGVVADSILALSVTCGAVSVSREGAGVVLRTGASVRALYLDEGGVPLVAERSIDVSCQLELPEDCRVAARAVCPEEVQGSLTDRGIEVRFPVDFRAEAAQRVKRVCVSAGKINTDAPKETTGAPSLVLRCLGKQETAWDLAKRYNTTIGVILAANQLETEGDISRDQLLLIPRKRT